MSVALGNVIVRSTDCVVLKVVDVLSTAAEASNSTDLELVAECANLQLAMSNVLLVNVSVVLVPTSVVVTAGIVTVLPPLVIAEMMGAVSVLLVST